MTCSSCKYLKVNNKYEGALCGAKYYCTKVKKYVDGSECCSVYEKTYSRSNYECGIIYEEGKSFSDDNKSASYYIFVLTLIILLGFILMAFNNLC